jgi:hypothetical protein
MRRIFWGFSRNWVLIDPLQYLSSRSAFGFKFAEIFVIEKRLTDSASRRVGDSPTWRVGESAFEGLKEKLGDSESRRLPDSANRGAANSPTRRDGESSTPRLGESGSRHGESESRYSNFLKFSINFQDFKRLNQPLKRSIWQKRCQGCNVLTPLIYLKVEKNCIYRHSCRLPDSASRGVVFRLRISPRIRSTNRNGSKYSVRNLCRTDFSKNPRKSASLPCPFKSTVLNQERGVDFIWTEQRADSIEWFIEDQAFLLSYDLAPHPPLPPLLTVTVSSSKRLR